MHPVCISLKAIALYAFLGDRWEQAQLVSYHNTLHVSVQYFWTSEYHVAYLRKREPWVFLECPGLSPHSYSTVHEALLHLNSTHRSRWLHPNRHWEQLPTAL